MMITVNILGGAAALIVDMLHNRISQSSSILPTSGNHRADGLYVLVKRRAANHRHKLESITKSERAGIMLGLTYRGPDLL